MRTPRDIISLSGLGGIVILVGLIVFTRWVHAAMDLPRVWVVSLGCVIGCIAVRREFRWANAVWLIFLAGYTVTTIWSVDPLQSLMGNYYCGWETLRLAVLCWLSYEVGMGGGAYLPVMMWVTGLAGAALIIAQWVGAGPGGYASWVPWPWITLSTGARPAGLMGNASWSAAALVLAMPWSPAWLSLILCAAAVLTQSRAAVLALGAMILWRYRGELLRKGRVTLITGSIVLSLATVAMCSVRWVSGREHLILSWIAIRAWLHHPWLGWGPGSYAIAYIQTRTPADIPWMGTMHSIEVHAHNLLTNILATQGLLGLGCWGLVLIAAWRVAQPRTREALIGMGVVGMLTPLPQMVYVVLALACGLDLANSGELLPDIRPWRRYSVLAVAIIMFGRYTITLCADHQARLGNWARAAAIEPTEWYYAQHVVGVAERSASMHRGNPLAYYGAVRSLAQRDKVSALAVSRAGQAMDPFGRLNIAP